MNTLRSESAGLVWRTRDTTQQFAIALLVSSAIALVSGLLLWLRLGHDNLAQVLLLTHLCAGLLAAMLFVPFIVLHWTDGREPRRHLFWPIGIVRQIRRSASPAAGRIARQRLLGLSVLWVLLLVLLSGLLVAAPALVYLAGYPLTWPYGGQVLLVVVHRLLTPLLILILVLHLPWRKRP